MHFTAQNLFAQFSPQSTTDWCKWDAKLWGKNRFLAHFYQKNIWQIYTFCALLFIRHLSKDRPLKRRTNSEQKFADILLKQMNTCFDVSTKGNDINVYFKALLYMRSSQGYRPQQKRIGPFFSHCVNLWGGAPALPFPCLSQHNVVNRNVD